MYLMLIKKKKKKDIPIETVEYTLSDLLPSGFIESNVGLDTQVARDDAWGYVQPKLNESGKTKKVIIHWDKSVAISDTLRLGGNTELNFAAGKGVVMMNGVSKAVLKNRTHRPATNANIVDKNITINGGIFNGNAININRGTPGQGMAATFAWHGVENLIIDGFKIYNNKIYAQIATNVVNGHCLNFVVDGGTIFESNNMDGLHWDGWCKNCSFQNGVLKTWDDAIAINADDGYSHWADFPINQGYLNDFYDISFNGPSSDILIKNITFNNENSQRGYGVRILSVLSRVDNIRIENLKGTCKNYAVLIDTYQYAAGEMDFKGSGNVGNVTVDDMNVNVVKNGSTLATYGQFSLVCSTEKLIATNVINNSDVPMLEKWANTSQLDPLFYGELKVNGVDY